MKRALFVSIVVAMMGLSSEGQAQMGVDDGRSDEYYVGNGSQDDARGSGGGAVSLTEARASGRGMRLGGGGLAGRQIPDRYTIRDGDTLWDISGHFYGNPWQWPKVWSYNPEITNPHWIYPDDTLRLVRQGTEGARLPTADSGARVEFTDGELAPGTILLRDQGYLDKDALEAFGEIVGSPEDHMLLTTHDDVYIQFGEESEVRRGMELSVYRRIHAHDRSPEESGELVRIFGTVQLRSYDPETRVGRAKISEALDPIERGFEVADIARSFEMVPPRENAHDLDARVVAALRPLQVFGDYQVIFISLGAEDEDDEDADERPPRPPIELGNRFFIVRAGDEWRDNLTVSARETGATDVSGEPVEYPDEIVAEARVANVRPNSAALMVTRAVSEIVIGDRAEMRRGY
ncbi:MAG: LysM peptidoglycan-binding domain-containing protein [Deltaproteobacteria bacterium]|nr:LysM peptidoglycan-binding domain-containing protein [Deltaproteobacteria bacterium]